MDIPDYWQHIDFVGDNTHNRKRQEKVKDYGLENRQYVIGGVAIFIVVVYILRLFTLQIMSDDYKKNADSNAFLKKIDYPSRGVITDRNGKLLVFNQPSYDVMIVINEAKNRLDTLEFCNALNITKEEFDKRMETIKDRSKNPGYSRFTQQLFMSQLSDKDFSIFREKMFRFPGVYIQRQAYANTNIPWRHMCLVMWRRCRLQTSRRMNTISQVTI